MENLHLPDNIKVHYAALENLSDSKIVVDMGINYGLYTAFPFVYKKINKRPCDITPPIFLNKEMKHVIQDSGLFSMLFGAFKDKVSPQLVFQWYDALVEWTLEHGQNVCCVELDAQAIIGVDETWKLRESLSRDLPRNRIMNVFHLQDGRKGLDRIIEYSDYIAIPSSELRRVGKIEYMLPLARYIKDKKPDIDIHLLGFTDLKNLSKYTFCTSCDSVTWLSPRRFGELGSHHVRNLDKEKIISMVTKERYKRIKGESSDQNTVTMCGSLESWKHQTTVICGNQDVKWMYNNVTHLIENY